MSSWMPTSLLVTASPPEPPDPATQISPHPAPVLRVKISLNPSDPPDHIKWLFTLRYLDQSSPARAPSTYGMATDDINSVRNPWSWPQFVPQPSECISLWTSQRNSHLSVAGVVWCPAVQQIFSDAFSGIALHPPNPPETGQTPNPLYVYTNMGLVHDFLLVGSEFRYSPSKHVSNTECTISFAVAEISFFTSYLSSKISSLVERSCSSKSSVMERPLPPIFSFMERSIPPVSSFMEQGFKKLSDNGIKSSVSCSSVFNDKRTSVLSELKQVQGLKIDILMVAFDSRKSRKCITSEVMELPEIFKEIFLLFHLLTFFLFNYVTSESYSLAKKSLV